MIQDKVNKLNLYIAVLLSMFIGGVLSLVDLPEWLFYFRPDWVALIVTFWILAFPDRLSIGFGLVSGIFLDFILVKPLGLNAMGFILLAYLVGHWSSQIRALTLWQQCVFLVVLFAVCKLLIGLIAVATTDFVFTRFYWYTALGNLVFWPLLFMILQEVKQAFLVHKHH